MLAARIKDVENIYVTDFIDERLVIARKEGALVTGNPQKENIVKKIMNEEKLGLDIAFECCGKQEAFNQAIDLLKPGGKIVVVGIPEFDNWSMNVETTRRREISLQFIRRQVDCVKEALELWKTDPLILTIWLHTVSHSIRRKRLLI